MLSRRICLLSHGQPAANPRLVRDAGALAAAGHDVRVVTVQVIPTLKEHDQELARGSSWQFEPIEFNGKPSWNYVRLRRRAAAAAANLLQTDALVARAYGYANPELANVASEQAAELFIAYQHNSLPAASWAARRHGARFALDAQDLLADCSDEPVALPLSIEKSYLSSCAYISTMSPAAARRLSETNNLAHLPIVLRNTPKLGERSGLLPPQERQPQTEVSMYWFGQTIGPHSLANQILDAMPLLTRPVSLVLRGRSHEPFVESLRRRAEALGLSDRLKVFPRAKPTEMVRLAAEHDILLGTQPGTDLFHQMAIGNKVFTGMMAGLALGLSDTIAHRELMAEAPGCTFLFRDGDVAGLVKQLNPLLEDRQKLQLMKLHSWHLAETRFNWEVESKTLLRTIDQILSVPPAAANIQ